MLLATWSTPIRRAARAVSAEAEDARDRDACLAGEPPAAAPRIVRGRAPGTAAASRAAWGRRRSGPGRSPGELLRRPDRRRRRLDRALVDLGDLLGDPRPGVALGAAAAGLPHRPDPLGLVGEELELLGKRLRIGRGHQDPVDAVGDDVAVPGDRRRDHAGSGGHRLDQHHAEALAGERGRAEQVRLAQLAPENRVRDLAEHVDVLHQVRVADAARDLLGVRADDGQPGGDVLDQRLEGGEQDRQALALLGAPDEEEPKLVARGLRALRRGLDVDAVGDDRVLAAEPAAPGPGGRLGDGDAGGELVEAATGAEQAGGVIREGLGRVGVERPHDGSAAEDHRVPADDRRQRLVHVDDVVVAGLELAAERDRALRKDREIRDRAVRADAERAPQRDQVVGSLPQLGMGAVQAATDAVRRIPGSQHANVIPPGDELLRQRLDVPVHASLIGPGIGRHKRNAHGVRVPVVLVVLSGGSHTSFIYPAGVSALRGFLRIRA